MILRGLAILIVIAGLAVWFAVEAFEPPRTAEGGYATGEADWNKALLEYMEEGYIGGAALHGILQVTALPRFIDAPREKQLEICERLSARGSEGLDLRFVHEKTRTTYAIYSRLDGLVFPR